VNACAAKAVVAVLVIALTFLSVAEDFVGFSAFFNFASASLSPGFFVGVIFDSQSAIGPLDVVGGGLSVHSEHFIVVAFGHKRSK
jgi:hypothetical protein